MATEPDRQADRRVEVQYTIDKTGRSSRRASKGSSFSSFSEQRFFSSVVALRRAACHEEIILGYGQGSLNELYPDYRLL